MQTSRPAVATPEAQLAELNSREMRYKTGQFFTPEPIASYMADRLMESNPHHVLDPGVGAGVLLRALPNSVSRYGLDIDERAVAISSQSLSGAAGYVEIQQGNFLAPETLESDGRLPLTRQSFDAIIANPPYIKHHLVGQDIKAEMKQRYAGDLGARPSKLSSVYVYFFLEAIRRLEPGGRLVFITPTEFLDVGYGSVVKEALLDHCFINDIVVFDGDHLTFGSDILSTSAITVATRRSERQVRQSHLTITEPTGTHLRTDIKRHDVETPDPSQPWTALTPTKSRLNAELWSGRPKVLADYARVRRGIATGSNEFFCLTEAARIQWGIEDEFLVPCLMGARSMPVGQPIDKAWFEALRARGDRCWLLWIHKAKDDLVGTNALSYIEHGELLGVPEAYNCRSRNPWYSVEQVPAADWFVTYMNRDNARFARNYIGARCMTSLLNVWSTGRAPNDWLGRQLEHADISRLLRSVGRTYGGGLGKTEPKELLRLPMPEYEPSSEVDAEVA